MRPRDTQGGVIDRVLSSNANLAVFGAAGTGKSYVRDEIAAVVPAIILGPTGISVVRAPNAMTIARFLGVRVKAADARTLVANFIPPANLSAYTIIIDEISMVAPEDLAAIDLALRGACNASVVCGGLRIILIGDPLQMEPVNAPIPFFETHVYTKLVAAGLLVCVLKHNFRLCSGDEDVVDMANFLADCRVGRLGTATTALLNYVVNRRKKPDDAIRLFAENADVSAYNLTRLHSHAGPFINHGGVNYKVGAPVMVTQNIYRPNSSTIKCANGSVGVITGVTTKGVVVTTDSGTFGFSSPNVPLAFAWALTVAKAQGLTLKKVVVSGKNLAHPGQAYVAVSRVARLSDVYGDNLEESNFTVARNPALRAFQELHNL